VKAMRAQQFGTPVMGKDRRSLRGHNMLRWGQNLRKIHGAGRAAGVTSGVPSAPNGWSCDSSCGIAPVSTPGYPPFWWTSTQQHGWMPVTKRGCPKPLSLRNVPGLLSRYWTMISGQSMHCQSDSGESESQPSVRNSGSPANQCTRCEQ
jgi:hypothetical protein